MYRREFKLLILFNKSRTVYERNLLSHQLVGNTIKTIITQISS